MHGDSEEPRSTANSLGVHMVRIDRGTFEMGSYTGDAGERPVASGHALQTVLDGVIHLIASGSRYRLNLAWLEEGTGDRP